MGNTLSNLVYFNSNKEAGSYKGNFLWILSGNILHVWLGDNELPVNSRVYQEIKKDLGLR